MDNMVLNKTRPIVILYPVGVMKWYNIIPLSPFWSIFIFSSAWLTQQLRKLVATRTIKQQPHKLVATRLLKQLFPVAKIFFQSLIPLPITFENSSYIAHN